MSTCTSLIGMHNEDEPQVSTYNIHITMADFMHHIYHTHKSIVQEVQDVHVVNPSQWKPLSSYSTQGTADCK